MLKVISNMGKEVNNIPLKQESATIGRNGDNTLVLEDPNRYISGRHAVIDYQNSNYFITDTSTNGVMINNATQPVGNGNKAKLNDGDQLRIGEYVINVKIVEEQQDINTIYTHDEMVMTEGTDFSDDPFVDLDKDPVQGVIDENQWQASSDWKEKKPVSELLNNPDSDFFAIESEDDDYTPKVDQPHEFKEAFHISPTVKNKEEKKKEKEKVNPTNDLFADDWFTKKIEDEGDNDLSSENPIEHEKSSPSPGIADTQTSLLIENFLRGAGFANTEIAESLTPESFYMIGKILRASVQGTMDVLIGRAKIKNEMHLDVTMIKSKENNPVKFSVSAEEAIRKLLAPNDTGYLSADVAIEEAFDDIRAHQFSVIAGMQTALFEILKRFEPQKLELRSKKKNPIASSIPIHRRAKLWDSFEHLYDEIEEEATDNFYRLFGQAFAESYEQQMIKLKHSKQDKGAGNN